MQYGKRNNVFTNFPVEILHSSIHSSKRSRNRKQGGYLRKEAHFVSWIFSSFKKLEVVKPNMTHHKVNAQTKIAHEILHIPLFRRGAFRYRPTAHVSWRQLSC